MKVSATAAQALCRTAFFAAVAVCIAPPGLHAEALDGESYFDSRVLSELKAGVGCARVREALGEPGLEVSTEAGSAWTYRYSVSAAYEKAVITTTPDEEATATEPGSLETMFRKLIIQFGGSCSLQDFQYLTTFSE